MTKARLDLQDGTTWEAESFGAAQSASGEVVFSTGMLGYPEGLTDPSFKGQILTLTYPIIGNYGVPDRTLWEADRLMVSGLIVSNYIDTPSHFQCKQTLASWFRAEKIPLIQIKDTRKLTQHIRDNGALLGKIIISKDITYYDPNRENLVAQVSTEKIVYHESGKRNAPIVLLIDCGAKRNIVKSLLKRNVSVIVVPWDFDPFSREGQKRLNELVGKPKLFDCILISNGPGDPTFVLQTITTVKKAMENKIPTLGICLGHQLLTLAAGGSIKKLKYGHRSQNQPCIMEGSPKCYITTQNHGFAVSGIPKDFKAWFTNANDQTNEGIIHTKLPFMSVQFHPEATPGPFDTEWLFDYFLERINTD
ncbi:MAG: glutamine-hydrolyzing carbamoyl-phosphate synthase small subunit [Patescibacteria group bacterium]